MKKLKLFLPVILSGATVYGMFVLVSKDQIPSAPLMRQSAPVVEEKAEPDGTEQDEILSPSVFYQSISGNYSVTYPSHWSLDDSNKESDFDVISDPANRVKILFYSTKYPALSTVHDIKNIVMVTKELLSLENKFICKDVREMTWKNHPTVFTSGVFEDERENKWLQTEYNVIRAQYDDTFTVSIQVQSGVKDYHQGVIHQIINSLEVDSE